MTGPRHLLGVDELFGPPARASLKLAPDGHRVAGLVAGADGEAGLRVCDLDRGDEHPVAVPPGPVRFFCWSRDGAFLLVLRDHEGDEGHHVYRIDPDRPDVPAVDLTPIPGVRAQIVDAPRADPRTLLVALNARDPAAHDLYRLDLRSGWRGLVAENPGDVIDWLVDGRGRPRVAYGQGPEGRWEIRVPANSGSLRVVATYENADEGEPYALTPDGQGLWLGSGRDSDTRRLVLLDLRSGQEQVVHADPAYDVIAPLVSERTGRLLAARVIRDHLELDAQDAAFGADLARAHRWHSGYPGRWQADASERRWLVEFIDDRDPGATFLYDRVTGEHRLLSRERPWLDPDALAPMTCHRIAARDGLRMHAYLTVPQRDGPGPLVLLVHGGPWDRDAWGYDPRVQFLANRGYAVLQVNFRGSAGFGKAFAGAAIGHFAGAMHDDLVDAVRWAVDRGVADPGRVAIAGTSYGGYAALVGAAFTPGVFAAAISHAGPTDLAVLLRSFPPYWRPLLAGTWHRYLADPDAPGGDATLRARSPISRVAAIRCPLLVIQGMHDPRVPKAATDRFVAEARRRGVEVEYLVVDDEGHGLLRAANRRRVFTAIERFLARHLPAPPASMCS